MCKCLYPSQENHQLVLFFLTSFPVLTYILFSSFRNLWACFLFSCYPGVMLWLRTEEAATAVSNESVFWFLCASSTRACLKYLSIFSTAMKSASPPGRHLHSRESDTGCWLAGSLIRVITTCHALPSTDLAFVCISTSRFSISFMCFQCRTCAH